MEKYVVKFNRPVVVFDGTKENPSYQTIYGFVAPYYGGKYGINAITQMISRDYVGYLASMERWSAGEDLFTVSDGKDWIDEDGNKHDSFDEWMANLCHESIDITGLDYTEYVIDWDSANECVGCGMYESLILCQHLMRNLVRLADPLVMEQNVILFNKPLWLPKSLFWKGEEGYCHIYGMKTDRELSGVLYRNANSYLGYLALCEDSLDGTTPSGYVTDVIMDGRVWYDGDEELSYDSEEIKAESRLCLERHKLRLRGAKFQIPLEEMDGFRDDYIISQELYESLLAKAEAGEYEGGCPNGAVSGKSRKRDRPLFER